MPRAGRRRLGGWLYQRGVSLAGTSAGARKGLIGPWGHTYPHRGVPGPAIGFLQEVVRWWEYWLKDKDTGIMDEPMLRAWMLDSVPPHTAYQRRPGRWVGESAWPSPRLPFPRRPPVADLDFHPYWPLAWAPPEPVTFTIVTGSSFLWLPERLPRAEDSPAPPGIIISTRNWMPTKAKFGFSRKTGSRRLPASIFNRMLRFDFGLLFAGMAVIWLF